VTVPELRIDPLTGLRVVLAPARADRPFSFESSTAHEDARAQCPLCEGREDWTPPETYALRPGGGDPDAPGWLVRAVPNKYPLLTPGDSAPDDDPLASGRGDPELLVAAPATGYHEVIVHAPEHVASITALDTGQFELAVAGWRERSRAHAHAACVHVMVNEGPAAGASLEHSHAQLYALDFVPALIARERERFTAHHTRTMGGCLMCDLLQEEVRRRERVVAVDDEAVLLAPFAARSPYELQLVPRAHEPHFAESTAETEAQTRRAPSAEPVGAHRAARRRALPLARRRRAAAHPAGGIRARHRDGREHRAARAGGRGALKAGVRR
jgi:UDPglucose--hexose-1-phosphate uridylyltransferase